MFSLPSPAADVARGEHTARQQATGGGSGGAFLGAAPATAGGLDLGGLDLGLDSVAHVALDLLLGGAGAGEVAGQAAADGHVLVEGDAARLEGVAGCFEGVCRCALGRIERLGVVAQGVARRDCYERLGRDVVAEALHVGHRLDAVLACEGADADERLARGREF